MFQQEFGREKYLIFKSTYTYATYTYALKRKTKFQFTPINFGVILILLLKIMSVNFKPNMILNVFKFIQFGIQT